MREERLTVGSLFSGIGGFDLGLERAGYEIKWQVENNEYCRKVLAKHWPDVPCHYDVTTIDWQFIPHVDLICGGFPCQPFSLAGKRAGKEDDRYLWPEVLRCLDALRPSWFLGENVPGLINLGLDQVCLDLESLDYEVWPVCIPACAVDAPHLRQRIWIISHTERDGRQAGREPIRRAQGPDIGRRSAGATVANDASTAHRINQSRTGERSIQQSRVGAGAEDVADDDKRTRSHRTTAQQGGSGESRRAQEPAGGCGSDAANSYGKQARRATKPWHQHRDWLPEPAVGRVAHGIPSRLDRLKGLGNAIVPQIAEALGRMILEAHER